METSVYLLGLSRCPQSRQTKFSYTKWPHKWLWTIVRQPMICSVDWETVPGFEDEE